MQECKNCGTDIIETEEYRKMSSRDYSVSQKLLPPYTHVNGRFMCDAATDGPWNTAKPGEFKYIEVGIIAEPKEDTNAGS